MAARKTTTKTRKRAAPKAPPPKVEPWWKHGEGLSKSAMAMVAALGMAGTAAGFIYRHFTAPERIPLIEQSVVELKGIHEKQEQLTNMKASVYSDECARGRLSAEACKRLGYPHADETQ